jgi:exopolyphosphatase/guanosine-5'-triphosphate,3'-diphosphate pyrophosphatase
MGKIIPRWEWRTFGEKFGEAEDRIKAHPLGNFKKSDEKYILSANSNDNTKIRDDLMDIKRLQEINADKLEQWFPVMKAEFPLSREKVTELCTEYFKIPVPDLTKESYTYEEYLELMGAQPDLRVVDVHKERSIYTINMAIVEIAEAAFNGKPTRTVCVEHEDPENVMKTVRELGLADFENVNYLRAMKESVGLSY